jgi:hypothetical protein
MSENLLEEYISVSLTIKEVDIDEEKLTIQWPNGNKDEYLLKNLKIVSVITTDQGPFMPDVFWFLLLDIPIMIPDDSMFPGTEKIKDILFKLPRFDYKEFTKAMCSSDNNAFEVWRREN